MVAYKECAGYRESTVTHVTSDYKPSVVSPSRTLPFGLDPDEHTTYCLSFVCSPSLPVWLALVNDGNLCCQHIPWVAPASNTSGTVTFTATIVVDSKSNWSAFWSPEPLSLLTRSLHHSFIAALQV